jgi:hypothetical protein
MKMPQEIRDDIAAKLWQEADELGWSALTDSERTQHYERWTRSPSIGVRLGHFMDPRQVRVYLKDSLLKSYERRQLSLSKTTVWRALGLEENLLDTVFIKPHGSLLEDGRVVSWGKSRDWKHIVLATFERAFQTLGAKPFAVVLVESGNTRLESERTVVREVAGRLGIEQILWLEGSA